MIDASTAAALAAKGGESKGSKGGESKHEGESKAIDGSASRDNIDDADDADDAYDADDADARRTRARSMARGWFVSHGYAPFDLSRGSLLRGRVLEVHAPGDPTNVVARFVVLVVHHIAVDLWSLVILLRDLGLIYDAEKAGAGGMVVPRPPTTLTWQYTDFAREQRRGLRGASGERMWQYWKQELTPLPPVLQLPTDRPRPPKRTFGGSAVNFAIGPRPTAQLRRMCAEGNLTPYSVLLAAFKTLLGRYAAAEDITVGSPMACRQSEEAEAVVGYVEKRRLCALYCICCTVCTVLCVLRILCMLRARPNTGVSSPSSSPSSSRYFVNIVCVRTDLSGDPTFAQLAQRTARKVRRKRGEVTEEKETSSLCAVCCMLCCCIVLCRMTSCGGHACDECGSPAAFYSLLQPLTASYSTN